MTYFEMLHSKSIIDYLYFPARFNQIHFTAILSSSFECFIYDIFSPFSAGKDHCWGHSKRGMKLHLFPGHCGRHSQFSQLFTWLHLFLRKNLFIIIIINKPLYCTSHKCRVETVFIWPVRTTNKSKLKTVEDVGVHVEVKVKGRKHSLKCHLIVN